VVSDNTEIISNPAEVTAAEGVLVDPADEELQ
jgi:hypothetical protein